MPRAATSSEPTSATGRPSVRLPPAPSTQGSANATHDRSCCCHQPARPEKSGTTPGCIATTRFGAVPASDAPCCRETRTPVGVQTASRPPAPAHRSNSVNASAGNGNRLTSSVRHSLVKSSNAPESTTPSAIRHTSRRSSSVAAQRFAMTTTVDANYPCRSADSGCGCARPTQWRRARREPTRDTHRPAEELRLARPARSPTRWP